MAGQRIDIMDLRSLITFKQKGLSNRKVADLLGVNRKTVDSYVRRFRDLSLGYGELLSLDGKDLQELFTETGQTEKERYEHLSGCFPHIDGEMKKPGCTLQVLWKEYISQNPEGYKYSQFTWHYRQWKKRNNASGKLSHRAGEKLFVDFCGKKLHYVDRRTGEQIAVEVFVGVLPCSQYTYIRAVPSQKREDFISCLVYCLGWMGGVPYAVVPDNLKSAVDKASKYAPVLNKTFSDFGLHYGCALDPARPYSPQDKSLVERSVTLVYQRIYYPLGNHTFFSLEELNAAIAEKLEEYNDYLLSHGQGSRRSQFLDIEKEFLQPLPKSIYSIRYYKKATVQKSSHVYLGEDKNYYSCPYRYMGKSVELQYNRNTVEIFYRQERIASHKRASRQGQYITIGEHMPSNHQYYNDWSPEYFDRRAQKVGPNTQEYIGTLIGQYTYPEIGYKQAQGILSFLKSYGQERLERACKRALGFEKASYHTLERILKNKMDLEELPPAKDHLTPGHKNIRGSYS
ncbi:IS21 family transposase [Echinicola jeungdonensis]|uniref:IS21 family transposase n=1 Tax=Echinicola jeungdonensis TaxID=709343 RepID=A0ABV5J293_9BACT|nr:IS21 family transposase [Echinicola jeungdonensis]MDN3667862.1 IS21 family transposase [Echinicola jeungdonensis]MDN3667972.1 IS21 family transposase [Echinicola jeungdonensis]MDN3668106.1 IS21 family transposase [Echinicola jeungdonensis]MDN3668705.1 IS21 family transposase [Echinicola jeungdonensis]MDN3668794.1 IS21 family transposase [Echinicola jeungdonensis]